MQYVCYKNADNLQDTIDKKNTRIKIPRQLGINTVISW